MHGTAPKIFFLKALYLYRSNMNLVNDGNHVSTS